MDACCCLIVGYIQKKKTGAFKNAFFFRILRSDMLIFVYYLQDEGCDFFKNLQIEHKKSVANSGRICYNI